MEDSIRAVLPTDISEGKIESLTTISRIVGYDKRPNLKTGSLTTKSKG